MNSVTLCQEIKMRLEKANIAYGNPDENTKSPLLWRISPRYFPVREKQWYGGKAGLGLEPAVSAFVDFYLTIEQPSEPFYFRLDATITRDNTAVITEWNLVPVGEAGVAINRGLYDLLAPIPENYHNPFPGNLAVLSKALQWYGGTAAILIPKNRRNYTRDYLKTAEMLRDLGVNIAVEDKVKFVDGFLQGEQGKIDVLLRIFPKDALLKPEILQNGEQVALAIEQEKVKLFPPFSVLESKESMAWLFNPPPFLDPIITAEPLREFVPWTWQTDPNPNKMPKKGWQELCWWTYFMGQEMRRTGFLLKPCNSFGGKNIVFSKEVKMKTWRRTIGEALINWPSEKTIIQKMVQLMEFPAGYLDNQAIVEGHSWKARFCITGVWLPEQGCQIGDIDVTLRQGTSLVHQQGDCIFVPVLIEKGKKS